MMSGGRSVPPSPSVAQSIGGTGLRGSVTGVTRIGARAGMIAAGVVAMLVLAIVYGLAARGNKTVAVTPVTEAPQILPTAGPLLDDIPGANATPVPLRRPAAPGGVTVRQRAQTPAQAVPALPDPAAAQALTRVQDPVPDIRSVAQTAAAQPAINPAQELKLERERQARQSADAARHSAIIINAGTAPAAAVAARTAPLVPASMAATPAPAAASPDPSEDPAMASQRAKAEFVSMQKSTTGDDYLTAPRQAAISPYEVQAGSIIPGILVTGINSDLPGQMIGQVSQNVYDSKTGQYLLIPAGSKLVGRYDSQVTNGQSRVLVAWHRIIFPDTSFVDIDGMTGSDTAGYSGFTGKVDDHSGKLFRNAILFSLIGAGATLLQPRTLAAAVTPIGMVAAAPSVGSQIAGQVGTQISSVASQVASRGLDQQPTIEVRPGYLFNIMVDRDLVLPGPYTK